MKLREYIEGLKKFAEENPEVLDLEVVTSKDDEGNWYNPVHGSPAKGIFIDNDFIHENNIEELARDKSEINAVCVN